MKIRIESDELAVEIESDIDPSFSGSVAKSLGETAIKLFKKTLLELRHEDDVSISDNITRKHNEKTES